MPETFDWIIVGGGIAGASAAYNLAPHGRVLVIERESQLGYHSTGRSEALFEPIYGGRIAEALAQASHSFFTSPPSDVADGPLLHPRGGLYFGTSGDEERLVALEQRALALGHRLEPRDPAALLRDCSILRPEELVGGFYDPQVCEIDVNRLHTGYIRAMRAKGGRLLTDVRHLEVNRLTAAWEVVADDSHFVAPVIINAVGAWADELAQSAGVLPLGHQPLRRTVLVIETAEPIPEHWPHVEALSDGFYFKPESGRLLVSPADEIPSSPCDAQPEELDIALAVARFEESTTLNVRRLNSRWAGLRTFLPDRAPAVGHDSRTAGFFWLSGLGGYGIMTAPAVGQACAALARGHALPGHLAATGVTEKDLDPRRGQPRILGHVAA